MPQFIVVGIRRWPGGRSLDSLEASVADAQSAGRVIGLNPTQPSAISTASQSRLTFRSTCHHRSLYSDMYLSKAEPGIVKSEG